jgi:hypothetical protein
MCGYAFGEAEALPRTMYREIGTDATGVSDGAERVEARLVSPPQESALERVILDVLIQFPDAYHAVVAAMREADGLPPDLL